MPHISCNTISQPFFLLSDQDHTVINLTGERGIWFAGEHAERLQLVAGDSVYLPAGIPSQVIKHTPSFQVRFKAETPGREAAVWYLPTVTRLCTGSPLIPVRKSPSRHAGKPYIPLMLTRRSERVRRAGLSILV